MKLNFRTNTAITFLACAALMLSLTYTSALGQQGPGGGAPGGPGGPRGGFGGPGGGIPGGPGAAAPGAARGGGAPRGGGAGRGAADPRVQNRTYKFEDTNEDLPYCVFVSSKVSKDKKNPLIISLHGLGIGPDFMCRGNALDLAEEGGYILAAPMGYSTGGWYGSPVMNLGGGGGRGGGRGGAPGAGRGGAPGAGRGAGPGVGAPGPGAGREFAAAGQAPGAGRGAGPGAGAPGAGAGRGAGGGGATPPNLAELSEKDVMNVLAMMRKEFTVDDSRTYLMGHSMGGAGTYFLGSKHTKEWAAIAPIAPASFLMNGNRAMILQGIKDGGVPMLVTQGDMDEAVPVTNTRQWVDTMKELKMDFEYKEYPGVTHGPIIEAAMPDIFAYFKTRTKAVKK